MILNYAKRKVKVKQVQNLCFS